MALDPSRAPRDSGYHRVDAPEVLQALRGIWELAGEELVVEVDQETGELMACTYEGEHLDPCSVVTTGIQLRPFQRGCPRKLASTDGNPHTRMRPSVTLFLDSGGRGNGP
jgi:hypothetical protein